MDRLYVLIFDRDESIDIIGLHNFIKDAPHIANWWHYIKSAYILRTSVSAARLSDQFKPFLGENYFLIYELTPPNSNGWLPDKAWAWIQRQERELGRSREGSG